MPRFLVDLDAIKTVGIQIQVEAGSFQEAYDKVMDEEVFPEDYEDEHFMREAEEIDIRLITDMGTKKVREYI